MSALATFLIRWKRVKHAILTTAAALSVASIGTLAHAGFTNGGFEDATAFNGWTVSSYLTPGSLSPFPPAAFTDLALTPVANNGLSSVVTAGTDSTVGGAVAYPLYGSKAALLNYGGNNNRASSINQTATMVAGDVDPGDSKVHVRFTIAPVLQNPGHLPNEQPYFFVEVRNLTKGTQLYHNFNFSGQSGVPWVSVGNYQYTNWQAIDIAPGAGQLDVGDSISVMIVSSGCALGGHEGHVYVDSGPTGTFLPGLLIAATGPATSSPGANITYTYHYSNSGSGPASNTVIDSTLPPGTTYVSNNFASATGGSCTTTPTVGGTGTLICGLASPLAAGGTGSFTMTVKIDNAATSPIDHGTYDIYATGVAPVLGPIVVTNFTTDLAATISSSVGTIQAGASITYTMTITNNGPAAVFASTVSSTPPSGLTAVTWACVAAGSATCGTASGSGAIANTVDMPIGSSLVFTVNATVSPSLTPGASVTESVTVAVPAFGIIDTNPANNTASVTNSSVIPPIPGLDINGMIALMLMLAGMAYFQLRRNRIR